MIIVKGMLIVCLVSYLFFDNLYMSLLISPYMVIYIKQSKEALVKKRKDEIEMQFCDTLEGVVAYLRSGASVEQSFINIVKDMELLYGIDSYMVMELEVINKSVGLDINIEEALKEFAIRVDIDVITNFAELFAISIKGDGNIIKVMETMSIYIKDNMELNRQVRMSINGVLQEISIMKIMPFMILVYLRVFSNGYVDVLYSSLTGYVIMAVILIAYVITIYVIKKMKNSILKLE